MLPKETKFPNVFSSPSRLRFTFFIVLFLLSPDFVKAQNKQIDSIAKLIKLHPNEDDERATLLFAQSVNFISLDPKKSLDYANQILAFQQKIKKKMIISGVYRLKGICQYYLSSYPDALSSINTALRIDKEINHAFGIASNFSFIAMIHLARSDFYEALNHYQQSIKIFETLKGHEIDVAKLYSNIGIVHIEMRDYPKALSIFNKNLDILRKLKSKSGEAAALTNIGVIYSKQNDQQSAIKYSEMARNISDSIADKNGYARETGNLAGYYSKMGKYDLALAYGLKAIELNKAISNTKSIGYNLQNVSEAYHKKGNYQQAKTYGLSSLKIGKELKIIEIQRDASEGLSKVYESLKIPDSALFYFKQFTVLADSITNIKKIEEITRLGLQYDFDKKETVYKQNQQLTEEQLKQQKLQLALNTAELQRGLQLRDLQQAQLENEKLLVAENQKQLIISKNNEKLQANKVKSLSQEQKLNKLELSQLWLYGILAVVVLISILVFLMSWYRIRQLRFKNTLASQQAKQNELNLTYQYQLSESELKAIRSQMNPHFIFNVLNSIESYIMDNDKKTASRLIQKFASLSRLILENSTKSLVTADKEWKTLMLYTELEAMRYNNSFSYQFIVEESVQLQTLLVPPMLVQPLIENAILHGLITSNRTDAKLTVELKKSAKGICITVTDNGTGLKQPSKPLHLNTAKEKSMGLESIRERIEIINQQHQGAASFDFKSGLNNEGSIAQLCLPLFKHSGYEKSANKTSTKPELVN
ncbi:tetratricopeptide repeat protein [Pedobacter frigiditerrae]|uniref:Tetratricopeptide repeat protein n=1 Tax=Pedobacter frigiditerrae TaxID=2530452 RepID=A0A4R0MQX2_9SPHI|nr:tetratricopeptide repeat protein [Pedobacter frigiditerrae]TCC88672.1 tetratricopeptide repeat protein [Pedobacter frigiditerrae]